MASMPRRISALWYRFSWFASSPRPSARLRRCATLSASFGPTHSAAASRRRSSSSSEGMFSSPSIAVRIICPNGQNVTCSSYWLGRPLSTVTSSSRPSRNSSTTRVLPIPGSPSSVTRCARLRSRTRSDVSDSSASSRRRSMNGIVERVERGARRVTGQAGISPSNSLGTIMRMSPNSTAPFTNWWVVEPTSTSSGAAACCSRAPMFTSPPITIPRSAAVPTATNPVLMPACTCIGVGRPSSRPSCGARFTTESAARIARTASSSCDVGTPNTASTASPMNDSARPRSHSTSSVTMPWNAASTSRNRSGSNWLASFVEPTRSTKTTVTSRRSDAGAMATGAPQLGQNLAPRGSGSPQREHIASLTSKGYGGSKARPTAGRGSWPSAPGTRPR